MVLAIGRSPVERIIFRIDLAALRAHFSVSIGQGNTRWADQGFFSVRAIYGVEVAIRSYAVSLSVFVDAKGNINVLDGRNAGAGQREIIYNAPLVARAVLTQKCAKDFAGLRISGGFLGNQGNVF